MPEITYNLLGMRLQALTTEEIVAVTAQAIENRERRTIANHNLHGVYICQHDLKMREFFNCSDYVHVDGMAIVALGRLMGIPLRREHRSTYIDLLPPVFAEAERKSWKIFYLGSKPGVADRAAHKLRKKYPALQMRTRHGYFDMGKGSKDNEEILSEINEYGPQIVMVGMGAPRQEHWVADNRQSLNCNVSFCCGAALDYVAGEIPTPPRWMGQVGLEWLYRLVSEPRRLWSRYLVEPWFVLAMVTRYLVGTRRDSLLR